MFRFVLGFTLVALAVQTGSAQFIRVPVVSFRPPVVPVHVGGVPGGNRSASEDGDGSAIWICMGIAAAIFVIVLGWERIKKGRQRTAGIRIRVVSVPDGEAPLEIRRAWVGVEFPALNRTPVAVNGAGVLTATPVGTEWGYIVDANVAVTALAATNPAAAAWWRTNVPNVGVAGAQLVFRDTECILLG